MMIYLIVGAIEPKSMLRFPLQTLEHNHLLNINATDNATNYKSTSMQVYLPKLHCTQCNH